MTATVPRMSEDVLSFSTYRRTLADCINRTERTRRPLFVTQNGHVTTVVMNIREYEAEQDELARWREREQLSRDIEISRHEFAEGKGIPHKQVMQEMDEMLRGWMREEGCPS